MATEKIMENAGQITDLETFATVLKRMLERMYPSANVEIHEARKNNNRMRTGILIRGEGQNIAPAIYLEEFFEAYRDGEPLDEICRTIMRIYQETDGPAELFDASSITDFAAVKGKICYELVNAEKNAARLRNMPHRLWQDLAVVYYVLLSKESVDGVLSFAVTNDIMKIWGVDEHTLYEIARQNTPSLFKAKVMPMLEVINGMMQEILECGQIAGLPDTEELKKAERFYVATNERKFHGAAVLLYDGVLERFAEISGSDFYILPSSVHETMFLPVPPDKDGHCLSEMVREINAEQVALEEVLSDNVYLYHAGDGSVTMVC